MSRREAADPAAIGEELHHCRALLDGVASYTADWRGHGGRAIADLADVVIHTIFARSTRTYEAIVEHLGGRGFGEQAAMLNRSLFEDMVDAYWVSLNRELAVERLGQHHRYSNRLKLDVAQGFPAYFGADVPELKPPIDDDERGKLAALFGTYGERSWTGLNLHARFAAIETCWADELPGARPASSISGSTARTTRPCTQARTRWRTSAVPRASARLSCIS